MPEDYKVQYTITINGNMLNLRGDSVYEVEKESEDMKEAIGRITDNLNVVAQTVMADAILRTPPTAAPGRGGVGVGVGDLPPPQSYTCKHGAMKFLGEKNYRFNYYCPAPKGEEQCPPQDKRN